MFSRYCVKLEVFHKMKYENMLRNQGNKELLIMANTVKMTFEDVLKEIESVNDIELVGNLDKIRLEGADEVKEYPYYLVAYGDMEEIKDGYARTVKFAPIQFVFLATLESIITELRHGLVESVPVNGVKPSPFLFVYDDVVHGYALYSYFFEQYKILDEEKVERDRYFKGSDFPIDLREGVKFYMDKPMCMTHQNFSVDKFRENDIITIPNYYDVTTFNYTNIPDGFVKPQTLFDVWKIPNVNVLIDFGMWELYLGYTDKVVINNGIVSVVIVADSEDFDKFIKTMPKNGRYEFDIFKDFVNIRVSYTFLDQNQDLNCNVVNPGVDLEDDGFDDEVVTLGSD